VTVTLAAEAGQLQLNVFEPVIAYRLLRSIDTLSRACVVLRERCVEGITPNPGRMRQFVEQSIGIVTALVPAIGYENATAIAKEALESGRGVYELVLERGILSREALDRLLNPDAMTGSGREPRRRKRLDPSVFRLPADQIKAGEYSDRYSALIQKVLRAAKKNPRVRLQVTAKQDGWLSGIDESIAILKSGVEDWGSLTVNALYEGDLLDAWDTVMTIEGEYATFAHLETLYLGVLDTARECAPTFASSSTRAPQTGVVPRSARRALAPAAW